MSRHDARVLPILRREVAIVIQVGKHDTRGIVANVPDSKHDAELDLQISLLAEHEVRRLAALLDAVAEHPGVEHGLTADIEQTKQDVDPAIVSRAIGGYRDGGNG